MSEVEAPEKLEQVTETIAADDFSALLQQEFKPKSERASEAVTSAVQTLAENVLSNVNMVPEDAVATIKQLIANIDEKLNAQVNAILHHDDFQALEGSWRGLHHLVNNTETDEQLKISVMNASKDDLRKNLKKFKGTAWDQSPLFKRIYEEEFGQLGGEPYGCLVGDYHFDHSPKDVDMLTSISKISAASHAPFITGAGSEVMGMDSWQELSNPRDLTNIFSTPDYAPWRSLRESTDSRYLALTMPRFLARLPYGEATDPVDEFAFEEQTGSGDTSNYCWANSAFAMAVNINRAFKEYGWCSRIRGVESGGLVEGLPCHTFPSDDGGVDMKCPTEVAISDRREAELSNNGFMPLLHRKNTDMAAFIGAQTLHKPALFDDPDATSSAALGARLPYLFSTCRFAHYLKCIVRDKVGAFSDRADMQRWLQNWVMQYVDGSPETSTEETKARKPLAEAEVIVSEVEGAPGYYSAKFSLRPHYQLEGLTVSLSLVSKLPSGKS